jgi:hypothetical protein
VVTGRVACGHTLKTREQTCFPLQGRISSPTSRRRDCVSSIVILLGACNNERLTSFRAPLKATRAIRTRSVARVTCRRHGDERDTFASWL